MVLHHTEPEGQSTARVDSKYGSKFERLYIYLTPSAQLKLMWGPILNQFIYTQSS